jgi:hypothetical protein
MWDIPHEYDVIDASPAGRYYAAARRCFQRDDGGREFRDATQPHDGAPRTRHAFTRARPPAHSAPLALFDAV